MQRATVKMISPKGFGFLAAADGSDYFMHASTAEASGLEWPLDVGAAVLFETRTNKRTGKIEVARVELVNRNPLTKPVRFGDDAGT